MPTLTVPTLYVDAVTSAETFVDAGGPTVVLVNRVPGPNEVDVLAGTLIAIDLYRSTSSGLSVDVAETSVYVGGVLAYDAGAFQTGFDGAASADTVLANGGLRVVIEPTTDFLSLEEITVRVVSALTGPVGAIDESWTFTVEDLDVPVLLSVITIDQTTIRFKFDEPVAIGSGFTAVLTATTTPAAGLTVIGQQVTGAELDLTVDTEMTPGATYSAAISGLEDLSGNTAAILTTFLGYQPPTPAGRSFAIDRMVPHRALSLDDRGSGDLRKFLAILQDTLDIVFAEIDGLFDQLNFETARQPWLDWILADLGNPFSFVLTDAEKRKLASLLVQIYRQNGTVEGIENAIRFFVGVEATISEFSKVGWVLGVSQLNIDTTLGPGSQRALYTFSIIVDVELTDAQREQILEIAIFMKPAHTHIAGIVEQTPPDVWTLDISALGSGTILG